MKKAILIVSLALISAASFAQSKTDTSKKTPPQPPKVEKPAPPQFNPDQVALKDLLHRLSRLALDLPEVAELDLNPVLAGPDGCTAVDARIRVQRPEPSLSPKTG